MSIAENLLRLHRWQLEEQRRYVAELESLAERLRADAQRLVDHIDAEASLRQRSGQGETEQRPFGRRLIERRKKLEHSIAEIEDQIVKARAAVAAAENEVEHYELAAAQRTPVAGGTIIPRSRRAGDVVPAALRARRHGS
jgi:flagellar protein FliJ